MEAIPSEHVQNVDNETSQIIASCLRNAIVIKAVFQHFSDPELLVLSLVNKMWNYEARSMMKKQGSVMALIVCHHKRTCTQAFEDFGADLRHINVVPFSGMTFWINPINPKCQMGDTVALESAYDAILDRLVLKQLSVKLSGKWWSFNDCTACRLVKRLLRDFSGVLEKLTLDVEKRRIDFIHYFFQDCSFPALKVLNLEGSFRPSHEPTYTHYIKTLISRAPNLEELWTFGLKNLMPSVLEGSGAVHVRLDDVHAPFDDISESLIQATRLVRLSLEYTSVYSNSGPGFNFQRFNRIAPLLLQKSSKILSSITIDAALTVPLMCYGISFENLEFLWLVNGYRLLEKDAPRIFRIVRNFDFTRIFPNLKTVSISNDGMGTELLPDHMNAIIEQADAVLVEPLPDRAANIKELHLDGWNPSNAMAPFSAEMFPNIEKLKVVVAADQEIPFGSIFNQWVDLREITVTGKLDGSKELDSVFCGIFPEEVAELRQKDEDYLKRVHIVPVMPAISGSRTLQKLSLNIYIRQHSTEPYVDNATFMFSKVTELIAFRRCPSLAVRLKFCSREVLPGTTHLKSFASVKCLDLSHGFYPRRSDLDEDDHVFMQQARRMDHGIDRD